MVALNETPLTVEQRAEFDRFVALIDETDFVPFPEKDIAANRKSQLDARNVNKREGVKPGPLGYILNDYAFERRVPGDVLAEIFVKFYTQK